ncbi:MAG: allophanate hydrolase [Acidobacterium sp.]|jgi:KipI family sensor histidine kinase inhibitor|nr:5-oxoprolinase subunit PxpB [Acidobacteriota bacterium]PHY10100.1 MAG: allophanate hydrolase [Acidobacterium sp.]
MRIRECGDSMLLVELASVIDPLVNTRAIALATRLRDRQARGVRDVAPGYCTIGVHFDPLQTDLLALEAAIADEAALVETMVTELSQAPIEIGVIYGGEAGPDLAAVAERAGCTPADVVERHTARTYRVYMLGFVPGFAYMGRVDATIAMPRHRVPRERVPAGSVGIAGEQTGVYPVASPGGWQLIGRTSTVMFDPTRSQASLLAPGDEVRFVPLAGSCR